LARGYAQIAGKSRKQRGKRAKQRGSGGASEPLVQISAIYRKKRKKSIKIVLLF
jgi:hypothetical protein